MPRVCHFTGKKTSFGRKVTHRGKAKYLGGVGTKVTGISARKFQPNIQRVRAVINGQIVRIKVSTKAIRQGLVVKPLRRKYVKPAAATATATATTT
jgi:large subunit ribosomal protein L28